MGRAGPQLGNGVVLALGGGGVRGVAHLGVLAELERAGVVVRGIAGTSSGALMGAMWLLLGSTRAPEQVKAFVASGLTRDMPDFAPGAENGGRPALLRRLQGALLVARALASRHILSHARLLERIAFLVPEAAIERLPLPFVVVATDHATGDEVWLREGSLRLALAASSAMPGLTAPIAWAGRRLQDGGAVAEIPVAAARSLGGPVLAVEVSEGLPAGDADRDRLPRAMFRAAAMGWQALRRRLLADADAVIAPRVNHLHWADYHAIEEAVEAGRTAALQLLERSR